MLTFSTVGGVVCLIAWVLYLPISPGFDNKSVEKNDILFLFIRSIDDEFDEEAIEPAEEALVNTCKRVDNHYTYTAQKTEGPDSNDDIDSGDNAMEIDEYTLDNGDVGC